jgi:hypothetical protein
VLRLRDRTRGRGESGIVAVNLVLVIAFALYAVIQLSRTTLAVKQIKNRVETITTEVGPGSNVSRLDETAILNTVADRAEQILAAARPLSGQANEILVTAQSIDRTVSSIQSTANSINGVVKDINGRARTLAPVVEQIRGRPGTIDNPGPGTGTTAINIRVDNALRNVSGIAADLDTVLRRVGVASPGGHDITTIHGHVNSINCSGAVGLLNPFQFCGQ